MLNGRKHEREYEKSSIVALNRCIEACTDGQKGYGAASADVRDPALKAALRKYETQRADFITLLQLTVDALGASHENEGTAGGALHRAWTGTRLKVGERTDEVVIVECIRGEEFALHLYDKLLNRKEPLLDHVRDVLAGQREAIAAALGDLRNRLAVLDRTAALSSGVRG